MTHIATNHRGAVKRLLPLYNRVNLPCFSDEDWRERSDGVQAPHQGEPLEMGPGQRQAGVQERQTRLHHRHPEASSVCSSLEKML